MFSQKATSIPTRKNLGPVTFADPEATNLIATLLQNANYPAGFLLGSYDIKIEDFGLKTNISFFIEKHCLYHGVIDLKNPDSCDNDLLNKIMQTAKDRGFLQAGKYFIPAKESLNNNDELYILPHHLRHRVSGGIDYYDVYADSDKGIGKGCWGSVYSPQGTMKPAFSIMGKAVYSPGREKRANKLLKSIAGKKHVYYYQCETKTTQQVGLFDVRDEVYFDSSTYEEVSKETVEKIYNHEKPMIYNGLLPFFSMRNFQGLSLENIFNIDSPKKKPDQSIKDPISNTFSPTSLFQASFLAYIHTLPALLSIIDSLLHSLEYDYKRKNFVHNDIKIANMRLMIDPVSLGMWIKCLDHGFSYHVIDDVEHMRRYRAYNGGGGYTALYVACGIEGWVVWF